MKTWKISIALILLLWFTGCWTVTGPAVLRLTLDSSGQRATILPNVNPESYKISISNGSDEYVFNTTDSNPSYEIEPGTWDVSVEGLDSGENVIAVGIVEDVLVSAGDTTDVTISLTAMMTGTGSMDVTVDWSNVDEFTVVNVNATLDGLPVDLDETDESSVLYQNNSVSSGNYMLIFFIEYGDSAQLTVAEAVQVYDNLSSVDIVYLENQDFTEVPAAPDSLVAEAVSSSRIDLSWNDNSEVEKGFIVQRSLDGDSFSDNIDQVGASITEYHDTGLDSDTRYYYRLIAYNDTGTSDPSNVDNDVTSSGVTYNISPPDSTEKLIFIHHSCGDNWLNTGNGNLGDTLGQNNYYVRDTYYGWDAPYNTDIGSYTDTDDWLTWFTDTTVQDNGVARRDNIMNAVYTTDNQNASYTPITDPGGENDIIMFKSCYPLSEVGSSIDDEKAIYNQILAYFELHQDKLFILITPPGETVVSSYENTRELCEWLVDEDTGWLSSYSYNNVAVFDFYGVLSEVDSHHTIEDDQLIHSYASDYDGTSPYHNGDNHPNSEGNQKSTDEYIPLLNYYYNRWKGN